MEEDNLGTTTSAASAAASAENRGLSPIIRYSYDRFFSSSYTGTIFTSFRNLAVKLAQGYMPNGLVFSYYLLQSEEVVI